MARILALMIVIVLTVSPAAAEDFCVSTAAELQNALTQAQGNAQDNQIRIVKGTYYTADNGNPNLGFNYANSMPGSLTITGGWLPNCTPSRLRSGAFETVLDGGNADRVLAIAAGSANVSIAISNLTIQFGHAPTSHASTAGALLIKGYGAGDEVGTVSIDRVAFTGNQGVTDSALSIYSYDRVDITNCLFNDNLVSGAYTASVVRNAISSHATYFINNTVVNNIRLAGTISAGVRLVKSGSGGNVAANNILWNNTSLDIAFSPISENQHLLYNTVQSVAGNSGLNVGNSDANPMLESDFRLQSSSPAIDAGFEPSPGIPDPSPELDWSLGDFDVVGTLRVAGATVDMGAFEALDEIFNDNFE